MNTLVRKGTFDAMHRVMNERMKCFNIHGHTYLYELHFEYKDMADIGYAIDFKEIKRVGQQWIDEFLDHGAILNPKDQVLIDAANHDDIQSKKWLMSLNGEEYCNPSAENIAKELFLAISYLHNDDNLTLKKIVLYETPNCFVECVEVSASEEANFAEYTYEFLAHWKAKM